ncbi:hypothetical protein QBC34DRAFT_490473 [Podospora aff. communis PSN243]|uniref:Zn(2)-C6 fungal-type domain-containing protein n=1 Tax=Podospora aff. communis PSN243 TaxID=3040156 RepID=A0AAV9H3Z8_9PEZI|nr:hypothetical protein QBC34DRAFT_490473 [Podospora aff. communis PSN243]
MNGGVACMQISVLTLSAGAGATTPRSKALQLLQQNAAWLHSPAGLDHSRSQKHRDEQRQASASNLTNIMSAPTAPMPRRQSCDRCHNQKVRCLTDGPEEIFTPGGTADDQEGGSALHLQSSAPVRTAQVDSQLTVGMPQKGIYIFHAVFDPFSAITHEINVKLTIADIKPLHWRDHLGRSRAIQFAPQWSNVFSSLNAGRGRDDDSNLSPRHRRPGDVDPMYFLGSSALPAADTTDCNPTLLKTSFTASVSDALPAADFVWHNQGLDFEGHFGELGQIHKRICQIARSTLPIAVSGSSPLVDDIFEVGCSLVSLTNRYTTSCRFGIDSWPAPLSTHTDLSESLETSFCLMALACQQIILALFQELLEAIVDSLGSPLQSHRSSEALPTKTSEADNTLKLAIHLLSQFDLSLAGLLTITGVDKESESPGSPSFSHSLDKIGNATHHQQYGMAATAFQQVDRRKTKLQTLVCTVRNLVEQTAMA